MRVALESDPDWRGAITRARDRGAELVCLPHLSFTPYVARSRDRRGLEFAQRAPAPTVTEAAALAGDAWLAASAYESEGEGVFYVTAYLGRAPEMIPSSRQRVVEAAPERYEQMFWSPGHTPAVGVELPCGPVAHMSGADVRVPEVWAALAAIGVTWVIAGTSEMPGSWERTTRVVAGLAAAYRLTALVVNRADEGFAGGGSVFASDGAPVAPAGDGLFDL